MLPISNSEDCYGPSCVRVSARGLPPARVLRGFGALSWFDLQPSFAPGGAKRGTLHRLLSPRSPTIVPPVVSPPRPRRVEGQRLCLCAPGVR
jgi:hypothetical protein